MWEPGGTPQMCSAEEPTFDLLLRCKTNLKGRHLLLLLTLPLLQSWRSQEVGWERRELGVPAVGLN